MQKSQLWSVSRWVSVASLLWVWVCAAGAQPEDASLKVLTDVRDTLRAELRQRAAADVKDEAPRDVVIEFDRGLGKGSMAVSLRRYAGRWFVRDLDQLAEAVNIDRVDTSGLKWEGDRIHGELRLIRDVEQGSQVADEDAAAADEASEAEPLTSTQTFSVDLEVSDIEPRLVLTFHRLSSREPWVLAYKRSGKAWEFDRELKAPRRLTSGGPFERKYPTLKPDGRGAFSGRIDLSYRGDQKRYTEAYTALQPSISFAGRLVDDRANTKWLLRSPSGKGLLGSGQDMLTVALQTATVTGKYRSTGDRGRWMGDAAGAVMPAPRDPVAAVEAEDTAAPKDLAAATAWAARVYREIRALDMALRDYPIPLHDALARTHVPTPLWPDGVAAEPMRAYLAALRTHAAQVKTDRDRDIATGHVAPDDETFGPYFGQRVLNDEKRNAVGAVGDGPQQWRALVEWSMVGPLPVFDQQAPVHHPEVVVVPQVMYDRTRLFTDVEGNIENNTEPAAWIDAVMDRATVAAPRAKHASAGSERYVAWYATTTLSSDREQPVWLSLRLHGRGMLWVNDRLVWQSGPGYDALHPSIFRVPLKKGDNRLLVRCATNGPLQRYASAINWFDGFMSRASGIMDFLTFELHVATQGKPVAGAVASQARPIEADAQRYRNNGTGVYASQNPPVAWDLERGKNVAWRIELPYGMAEPVVRDGRLFVTGEPNVLLCIDVESGDVLWQKTIGDVVEQRDPSETYRATVGPLVTGDSVFVYYGSGVAARLDHDGDIAWQVDTGMPWKHPNMGEPWLVDGKLILQGSRSDPKKPTFDLLALDIADGRTVWTASGGPKRVHSPRERDVGLGNGVAALRLTNGEHDRTLLISGDGAVIDAADGELLHRDILEAVATRTPPYVVGDVVYTTSVVHNEAVRLWLDSEGRVGAKAVWRRPQKMGRGQAKTTTDWGSRHWMKGPVIHDGSMYVVKVDSAHVPQHYMCPWTQLEIFDIETGKRVMRARAMLREATDPTVAPALAGRYLYVADGGAPVGGFGGTTAFGQMAVLELMPDDTPKPQIHTALRQGTYGLVALAARNRIERTRCAPVFDGDRMFLRSFTSLACIAVAGNSGRDYQQQRIAETTAQELVGLKPDPIDARALEARAAPPGVDADATVALRANATGDHWLVLGPIDAGTPPAELTSIADMTPTAGATVTFGDQSLHFRPVAGDQFVKGGPIDTVKALGGDRNCIAYFYTVLESQRSQRLRYKPDAVVTGTWIAGQPVQPDDVLDFDLGYYPMLVQVKINRLPEWVETPKLTQGFAPFSRTKATPEQWAQRIKSLEPRLRWIMQTQPGTGEARTARVTLKGAGLNVEERDSVASAPKTDSNRTASGPPAAEPPAQQFAETNWLLIAGAAVVVLVIVAVVVAVSRRK